MANKVETVPGSSPYKGKEQVTSLSASKGFQSIPNGARWAVLKPRTQAVYVNLGAAAATSADMLIDVGQPLEVTTPLAAVRIIEAAASATVDVWYFE